MKNLTITLFSLFLTSMLNLSFGQSNVRFIVKDLPNNSNQKVGIRGNVAPLDWSKSIPLQKAEGSYYVDINFI